MFQTLGVFIKLNLSIIIHKHYHHKQTKQQNKAASIYVRKCAKHGSGEGCGRDTSAAVATSGTSSVVRLSAGWAVVLVDTMQCWPYSVYTLPLSIYTYIPHTRTQSIHGIELSAVLWQAGSRFVFVSWNNLKTIQSRESLMRRPYSWSVFILQF